MKMNCAYCNPQSNAVLSERQHCLLIVPERLHIPPSDGGHLIVVPRRHLATRAELSEDEVLDMWRLSLVGARALSAVLSVDWFNYQENGNWTVENPEQRHLHLHVYGRHRDSVSQPFGEALRFPLKNDIVVSQLASYSEEQVNLLRQHALQAAREVISAQLRENGRES